MGLRHPDTKISHKIRGQRSVAHTNNTQG